MRVASTFNAEHVAVMQAVPALLRVVENDPKMPQGKLLYVKLGCRGDWPDLQHPDWKPDAPVVAAQP